MRVKDPHENVWKKGTVITTLSRPRSYVVEDEESRKQVTRNRALINPIPEGTESDPESFNTPPASPTGKEETVSMEPDQEKERDQRRRSSHDKAPLKRYDPSEYDKKK